MLSAYKRMLPKRLAPYAPFPRACEREGWAALPEEVKLALTRDGEAALAQPIPPLYATDYLLYSREGDRGQYEGKYFKRRGDLFSLVLAECAQYQGRYVDAIANRVWAILEESGWQIPAHNNYVRDGVSLPLPDAERPVVDLFAAETGASLALILYLLGDELDAVSPLIGQRIQRELQRRIIDPFLNGWFWWMGSRGEPTLNWTVWCAQNVLYTALLMPLDEHTRLRAVEKVIECTDYFIEDYGQDGCCDEGASYYRKAGLCLFAILDALEQVTGGLTAPLWQQPKIGNIARYIRNVHVHDRWYFNFADCSPFAGRAGIREFLFGKKIADEELCAFAALEWRRDEENRLLREDFGLHNRATAAFAAAQIAAYPLPEKIHYQDLYYPSAGLFIARDERYSLAVKAGDNADNHNHNDTGSLILFKDGRPFLIDIGVERYSRKTFSPQRYEIWTMQSSWHNLPEFDGHMQRDGEAYRATDVHTCFSHAECKISMRLEEAWAADSGLASFARSVTLTKGKGVTVLDRCEGSYREAVLNLMLCAQPTVQGNVVKVADLGEIAVEGAKDIAVEAVQVTDGSLRRAWPEQIYRLRIGFERDIALSIV